ncbi:hypothetical protein K449DRAFT_431736 [Hypoxylon sp. EC38]|nr:hypothetical protein K449DRAFT_431736 [Hypoxylon sp. EC38]
MDAERRQYCERSSQQRPNVLRCDFSKRNVFAPHIRIIPQGHADLCFHCLSGTRVSRKCSLTALKQMRTSLDRMGTRLQETSRRRRARSAPRARTPLVYLREVYERDGVAVGVLARENQAEQDVLANGLGLWAFANGDHNLHEFRIPTERGPIRVISTRTNMAELLARSQTRELIVGTGRLEFQVAPQAPGRSHSDSSVHRTRRSRRSETTTTRRHEPQAERWYLKRHDDLGSAAIFWGKAYGVLSETLGQRDFTITTTSLLRRGDLRNRPPYHQAFPEIELHPEAMCIEIWNSFQLCNHRVYQNTFPCHIARRCAPEDDLLLERPKFVPDNPPKIPPGLLECKLRVATRPKNSRCPECIRAEQKAKMASSGTASSPADLNASTLLGKNVWSMGTILEEKSRESSFDLRAEQTKQPTAPRRIRKQRREYATL